jgi:hypothetical protein
MGFLDHSTNNIIVDAVLTDHGRKKLAAASGTNNFVLTFGFGDDEIDYTMIKKYGIIVGKEKIEKNTPVFEASTNEELGVKYFLTTVANPIVAQPTIATTVSQKTVKTAILNTNLTIQLTDAKQIINSIAYDIAYDPNYLTPVGAFQIKKKGRFSIITREAKTKEDITIRFTRGLAGADLLKKISKTKTITPIRVRASTGAVSHVSVIVEYD